MTSDKSISEPKYTTMQAAPLLGLKSFRSVSRLCFLGKIPGAYRVGGNWRIPESSIKKVMEQKQ